MSFDTEIVDAIASASGLVLETNFFYGPAPTSVISDPFVSMIDFGGGEGEDGMRASLLNFTVVGFSLELTKTFAEGVYELLKGLHLHLGSSIIYYIAPIGTPGWIGIDERGRHLINFRFILSLAK